MVNTAELWHCQSGDTDSLTPTLGCDPLGAVERHPLIRDSGELGCELGKQPI